MRKIAVFSIFFCILFFLLFVLINYANNQSFVNYRVKPAVESIFVGDSHIQMAINDSLIPNSINLSQDSESNLFSFFKIRVILKNNPSITKLYLGFGYHNISSYYDDYTYGVHSKHISTRYFFILPFKVKMILIRENIMVFFDFIRNTIYNGLKNLFVSKNKSSFLGFYQNEFKNTLANKELMNKRILGQFYENNKLRNFSYDNISYLMKIRGLCKESNVKLIILNTPLHSYYRAKIPIEFIKKYYSILRDNHLEVLEFSSLKLNDNCFVPDGDHVSQIGASLTTQQILVLNGGN